jgi:hypothetical protein
MPKTRSMLKDKGMSFQNAFVSNSLGCPSRATIMRGQYAHNTEVWTNRGSDGGWQAYKNHDNEKDNVATRLDEAGYRTGLFGKYLNGYDGSARPVGWDRWFWPTLEMAGAPMGLGIILIAGGLLGIIPVSNMFEWVTRLACPVMLVPMLFRFNHYAGGMSHHAPAA